MSVDPHLAADTLTDALAAADLELRLGTRIIRIERRGRELVVHTEDGAAEGPFDHVVNAAWEDRLRLDATLGQRPPDRPLLHRYKVALHHRGGLSEPLPSLSLVVGPYGDVVSFGDRSYLSWYPACRIGMSSNLAPPAWDDLLDAASRSQILADTIDELGSRLPAVKRLGPELADRARTDIEGGHIVAWGDRDVDEPETELHERFDVGLQTDGAYHSLDTGKYCLAAGFAYELRMRLESA